MDINHYYKKLKEKICRTNEQKKKRIVKIYVVQKYFNIKHSINNNLTK